MSSWIKQVAVLFTSLFLLFYISACANKQSQKSEFLPKKLKVILEGGITIRENTDGDSKSVGVAHNKYTYDILEGYPRAYQIKFIDNQIGWISANPKGKWTELTADNQVKVLLSGGITVRAEPNKESKQLGVAASKYTFEIVDILYSYYKVQLPESNSGWIYAGKPGDEWVEVVE